MIYRFLCITVTTLQTSQVAFIIMKNLFPLRKAYSLTSSFRPKCPKLIMKGISQKNYLDVNIKTQTASAATSFWDSPFQKPVHNLSRQFAGTNWSLSNKTRDDRESFRWIFRYFSYSSTYQVHIFNFQRNGVSETR